MIIGYSLIEIAQIRPKNYNSVVTKNMLILTASLATFFLVGYAISFGGSSAGIAGA
jgi:ammonia channel protein AmtB